MGHEYKVLSLYIGINIMSNTAYYVMKVS